MKVGEKCWVLVDESGEILYHYEGYCISHDSEELISLRRGNKDLNGALLRQITTQFVPPSKKKKKH